MNYLLYLNKIFSSTYYSSFIKTRIVYSNFDLLRAYLKFTLYYNKIVFSKIKIIFSKINLNEQILKQQKITRISKKMFTYSDIQCGPFKREINRSKK